MAKLLWAFSRSNRIEDIVPDNGELLQPAMAPVEAVDPASEGGRRSYEDRALFSRPAQYEPAPLPKKLFHGALSVLLSVTLAFQPIASEVARAQAISDPAAPIQFRPNVTSSGNGTPLVNIVTPSFGGVSHNKFQSYDIDTRGIILNNSALGGQSVIGGAVSGNPNLNGSAPARVIVNEVTGSRSSVLNGPTEVFGATADVVVANPNGISCVSCSFINTGKTTLTSGVPTPDYNTGAISYRVTTGAISISGTGLNAGNAPLGNIDLIGRQVVIDGPVSSNGQVRIRAGALNYDQATDAATAIAGAPAVTGLAVSSSLSGTITAGSVSVLSKDVNLGISLAGDIATLDGHLIVQGAGDITLANVSANGDISVLAQGAASFTGAAQATGRISANGNDVNVASGAALTAIDAIVLQAGNAVNSAGSLQSGGDISLTAGNAVIASGVIQAGGQAVIEGDRVTANSVTVYGTEVTIIGRSSVELNETALSADGSIRVMAPDITLGQNTGFQTDGLISLDAKHDFFTDSVLDYPNLVLTVKDDLGIGVHGALIQDVIDYTLTGTIDNAGQIYGRNSTVLAAANLINETGGQIYGPDVTLTVTDQLSNLGLIVADDTLKAVAATLGNGGKGIIYADTVALSVTASLDNQGAILSAGDLTIDAGSGLIANGGSIQATDNLSIATGDYTATKAAILGGNLVIVTASGGIDNAGVIIGDNLLLLRAASLNNRAKGVIQSYDIGLALSGDMTNAGLIAADGLLNLAANNLTNKGTIFATEISRPDPGNAGSLASGITLTGKLTNSGVILTDNNLMLAAKALQNNAGATLQGKSISALIDNNLTNNGAILSDSVLILAANNLTNSGDAANTATISGAYLQATVGKTLTNGGYAVLQGSESTVIRAQTATLDLFHVNGLDQGIFNYGKDFALTLSRQGLTVGAGQSLIADGSLYLSLGGDVTVLGTIASRKDLSLNSTGSIVIGSSDPSNPGGAEIFTHGNAELIAGRNITNNASIIQTLGSMYIQAGGTVTNTRTAQKSWLSGVFNPSPYIISTGGKKPNKYTDYQTTYTETSQAAEIWVGGDLVIVAGAVTNDASTIYANGTLAIQAATVNNRTRDTGIYFVTRKEGGSANIGKNFGEGWIGGTQQETPAAMIGNAAFIGTGIGIFNNNGSVTGSIVRIDAQVLINGITDPNRFTAPSRLPDPVIDLTRYFNSPGSVSNVTVGNITYLHGSPISGGINERGPSWILQQIGDTRGDLIFFADPTTEQRLINQALIEQTGQALLDPAYRNAADQQQGLWQGTVDYLEAHPDVKLGDALTDSQRAAVHDPILWYHAETIDGQTVLVPELILPEDKLSQWAKTNGGSISGDSIYLSGDTIYNSGSILAGQDLTIDAGTFTNERRVTTIGGTEDHAGWQIDYLQDGGVVSGGSVTLVTQGDLYNIGGSILAGTDLTIITGGNLILAPQTVEVHWEDGSKNNGGKVDDTINFGGAILSGGSAVLIAGGDLDVIGSTVKAAGDLTLASLTGDVNIVASVDVTDHTVNDDGVKDRNIHVTNNGSQVVAGGDLTIVASAGDVTLQASHLGGESITISAADTVHFATGTDEDIFTETGKSSNGLTQTFYNNGSSSQNLVYDTMDIGSGGLKVIADQIVVDYLETIRSTTQDKKGNEVVNGVVTQSPLDAIQQVLDNPGMGWLAQVTSDGTLNVTFNGQTITNSSWDHDQTTLTPAAAALIAVVVAVITAGAASAIGAAVGIGGGAATAGATGATVGAAAGTGAAAASTSIFAGIGAALAGEGTVMAGAIGAGLQAFTSSVISGTIIGAINGDLDMGNVLLNALASGLTAGLTNGINTEFFGQSIDNVLRPGVDLSKVFTPTVIIDTAGKIVVDSVVSAGIRAALLGQDFGDNFLDALARNAVNVFIEPVGFYVVGDMGLPAGSLGNALLHAVVGAAGGYIVNGVDGLAGGALGAFLGELVLAGEKPTSQTAIDNMRAVQQIIGGLASLVVGDASMSGADAALNGFNYNYLNHQQMAQYEALKKRAEQCNNDGNCSSEDWKQINAEFELLKAASAGNTQALREACSSGATDTCKAMVAELQDFVKNAKAETAYLGDTAGGGKDELSYFYTMWVNSKGTRSVNIDSILADEYQKLIDNPNMTPNQVQTNVANRILEKVKEENMSVGQAKALLSFVGVAAGTATIVFSGGAAIPLIGGGLAVISSGSHLYGDAEQAITGVVSDPGLVQLLTASNIDAQTAINVQRAIDIGAVAVNLVAGGVAVVQILKDASLSASEVSALERLMQQTGVESSTSGYINSSKVTMGGQTVSLTGEQQALVARIVAEGDQTGMLTENLVESIAKGDSGNFTILSGGKYGSNNGFDLVVQASDGSLIILDAKQMNSGAFKLGTAYNGQIQLSEGWVEGVLNRLDSSSPAAQAIQNSLNNGNLITGVAGVNKSTGELIMLKITP